MDAYRLLQDLAVLLGAAIMLGFVAQRLRQPVLLGYLIGGLLVGPYGLGWVRDVSVLESLAELGVVLLMFTLGVEFSLAKLRPLWRVAVLGGLAQIGLVVGIVGVGGGLLGFGLGETVLVGCVLALSSTVIVLKVLMERGELDSMHGQIALGLLIVQDLAVVPIMVILPQLAGHGGGLGWPLAIALGRAALILAVVGGLGTWIFPQIMRAIARTGSKELFMLTAVALCFGTAAATHAFGLSLALGAFLAGVVVAESDHSHQIMAEVLPLRDLFAALFFVSIGMLVDLGQVARHWSTVAGLLLAIVVGKALVVTFLVRAFGYAGRTALAVGLSLAQIGEFSFVLARMGQEQGLFPGEFFSMLLAAALLSILATPLLLHVVLPLARFLPARRPGAAAPRGTSELVGVAEHVVICGFGRVGSHLGEVLLRNKMPMLVVDLDVHVLDELQRLEIPCLYGDASNPEVLRHARLPLARLVVIALPDHLSCLLALDHVRRFNPRTTVLVRAHRSADVAELHARGADHVIQPEFEASLEAIRFTLATLGAPARETYRYLQELRRSQYHQLMDGFQPDAMPELLSTLDQQDFTWLMIAPEAFLVGQNLRESRLRTLTGAAVLAIRRQGAVLANPDPATVLEAGDEILVMGFQEQLAHVERLAGRRVGDDEVRRV